MAARRPLVLHFDINKTIIMCDPVKGVDCDMMLNSLLSEVCWGKWDEVTPPADSEGKMKAAATWRMEAGPTVEVQPGMITYAELLEEVLKVDKKQKVAAKVAFTEPGNPGESVRQRYLELREKLSLPKGVTLSCAPAAVGPGRHFLLPSFFHMLRKLHDDGREFRIVFRTFGVDLPEVIHEFNAFCNGEHPCYPDVPKEFKERAVAQPVDTGEWYREADGTPHLSLCEGGLVTVKHGWAESSAGLHAKLFGEGRSLSFALRDYYPYWRDQKEADNAGKPLMVQPFDSPSTPHHMFFDDNVERRYAHIVDARAAPGGEPMPFARTQGSYLIRSEPLHAIQDPDYFAKAVAAAEEAAAKAQ
eukprot:TRINITY_DN71445_c0_g1_i1.p1 TRINITY_DN71445_c0_g1~~TRINITY_DN71445_c0_g1_i1.p1  ORF type:complete len:359 (+),score=127.36 TRINITY_DN71445_c0_g1_i1:36-1112(+)